MGGWELPKESRIKFNITQVLLTAICVILIAFGVFSVSMNSTPGNGNSGSGSHAATVFSTIYYYEPERDARYEAYSTRKPEMTHEEVVWRVNAELDTVFYSKINVVSDFDFPILVNKFNKLPDDYVPKGLMNTSSGQMMTADTKAAYEAMRDGAGEAGFHINAVSDYKSIEYQKGYYNKAVMDLGKEEADKRIPRAGFSEHHLGTAVDLAVNGSTAEDFASTPEAAWVAENAYLYGFIVRYTEENSDITGYDPQPWQVTYVGVEISERMRQEGISSLEEYHVKYV
jgi:D-alanyl-D-alanine carboxypeptidase